MRNNLGTIVGRFKEMIDLKPHKRRGGTKRGAKFEKRQINRALRRAGRCECQLELVDYELS